MALLLNFFGVTPWACWTAKGHQPGGPASISFHDEDRRTGKIRRVAFEDNGIALRGPGWMEIVRAGEVIVAIVGKPTESVTFGICHPDLLVLWVAAVSREGNRLSIWRP